LLRTDTLSSVAMKLESSTETTAALSQGRTQTSKFVTINDVGDEIGVIFGLFLALSADNSAVFLLITAQQPWHKFCCIVPHVEVIQQNSLAHSVRQSDSVANVVNRLSLVFQDSLSHFCQIFNHGSGRRSSRTLVIN